MAAPILQLQFTLFRKISSLGRNNMAVWRCASTLDMAQSCKAGRQKHRKVQPRPHKQMLAAEVRELFDANAMVAVLSYFNMRNIEWNELIFQASKSHIHFRFLPNKIVHRALDSTPYVNICPLFISTNVVAYSEDVQVNGLLDALKHQKKVQLLGGKIHDRLFAVDGFNWVSDLPSLLELHSQLSAILSQPGQNISQILMKNQQILSHNLGMLASKHETGP